jgi:hypothetical protein
LEEEEDLQVVEECLVEEVKDLEVVVCVHLVDIQ